VPSTGKKSSPYSYPSDQIPDKYQILISKLPSLAFIAVPSISTHINLGIVLLERKVSEGALLLDDGYECD
jgi:hypothetical protein